MTISQYPTKKYLTVKNCTVEKRCCSLYNKQIHLCRLFWFLWGSWVAVKGHKRGRVTKQQNSSSAPMAAWDMTTSGGILCPSKSSKSLQTTAIESIKTREKHCLNLISHPFKSCCASQIHFVLPQRLGLKVSKSSLQFLRSPTSRVQSLWHQTSLALP